MPGGIPGRASPSNYMGPQQPFMGPKQPFMGPLQQPESAGGSSISGTVTDPNRYAGDSQYVRENAASNAPSADVVARSISGAPAEPWYQNYASSSAAPATESYTWDIGGGGPSGGGAGGPGGGPGGPGGGGAGGNRGGPGSAIRGLMNAGSTSPAGASDSGYSSSMMSGGMSSGMGFPDMGMAGGGGTDLTSSSGGVSSSSMLGLQRAMAPPTQPIIDQIGGGGINPNLGRRLPPPAISTLKALTY